MLPHSAKKKCDSGRSSCQECDKGLTVLNLSVNGASAFMHSQRPKTFREYKSYRIVYLAERLELTTTANTFLAVTDVAADGSLERADDRPPSGLSLDLSSITADDSDEHVDAETQTSSTRPCDSRATSSSGAADHPKDLVNLYMRSVDKEKNLAKYFRACSACGETYCVCAVAAASDRDSNKPRATATATATEECKKPCDFHCCCPDFFETDYLPSASDEECCCHCRTERVSRSTALDNSVRSDRVLAYTSSLANAARSARVLARDLELVLSTLRND